jgi:hypothetical protein
VLATEDLVFDDDGRPLTRAPSYLQDPLRFDSTSQLPHDAVRRSNREHTIYRSKAVGEPPLMLPTSGFAAVAEAIHSLAPGRPVPLDAPATPEAIYGPSGWFSHVGEQFLLHVFRCRIGILCALYRLRGFSKAKDMLTRKPW